MEYKEGTEYFSWELGPAVIEPGGDDDAAFFIPPTGENWIPATPSQVFDFVISGSELSKSEFVKIFGSNLTDLPKDVT